MAREDIPECPVCGDPVKQYEPATAAMYEDWRFECGGEIYRTPHEFVSESDCGNINPMDDAVAEMNAKLKPA